MDMKLTFLGTSGTIPSKERNLSGIALKTNNLYLWDCGEGTQRQMMKFKVGYGSIEKILISHLHIDHFLGVFGIIETLKLTQPKPLEIYAPKGFEELLINECDFVKIQIIKPGKLFDDGKGAMYAFRVNHKRNSFGFYYEEHPVRKFYEKKAKSLGIRGRMFRKIQEEGELTINGRKILLDEVSWLRRGRKVVYSGDTIPSENTIKAAENADILIHDATFSSDFEKEANRRRHSTSKQAAEIAKRAGVKKLILTHISNRYSKNVETLVKEAREIFPNTIVAKDGMVIEVPIPEEKYKK